MEGRNIFMADTFVFNDYVDADFVANKPTHKTYSTMQDSVNLLREEFATNAQKLDTVNKSGQMYTVGKIGIPGKTDTEYRVWKSTHPYSKESEVEYIYKGYDEEDIMKFYNELQNSPDADEFLKKVKLEINVNINTEKHEEATEKNMESVANDVTPQDTMSYEGDGAEDNESDGYDGTVQKSTLGYQRSTFSLRPKDPRRSAAAKKAWDKRGRKNVQHEGEEKQGPTKINKLSIVKPKDKAPELMKIDLKAEKEPAHVSSGTAKKIKMAKVDKKNGKKELKLKHKQQEAVMEELMANVAGSKDTESKKGAVSKLAHTHKLTKASKVVPKMKNAVDMGMSIKKLDIEKAKKKPTVGQAKKAGTYEGFDKLVGELKEKSDKVYGNILGMDSIRKGLEIYLSEMQSSRLEKGVTIDVYETLEKAIKNPKALAAWIGRRKYGKERFQRLAAQGKKKAEKCMGSSPGMGGDFVPAAQQIKLREKKNS